MWSMVAQRLTQITSPFATPDQLWQRVEAAWSAVPLEHIQSLFESMPRRVGAYSRGVLEALGEVLEEESKSVCSKSSMSRSNSAIEVDFYVDPRPEDYPLTGSRWIEEYIGDIRTLWGCGSPVVKVSDHDRHVMSSSPVPLKTYRVGKRRTLNLSIAHTPSRWCDLVVRRGGSNSGVVLVT
ncbi:transposable element Tcb1 transposase [Trichonephila clavipes]|nr:transposable element Tcb1 transposase [Trichonephila clavipes]